MAEYDKVVRSPSTAMRLPSVVALREYRPMPTRVAFTRFNVFLRDRFRCQYCGGAFTAKELTFEHVVPRSFGGKTAWDNIVAACEPCNVGKDNKLLMKPMRTPGEPTPRELLASKRCFPPNFLHESWAISCIGTSSSSRNEIGDRVRAVAARRRATGRRLRSFSARRQCHGAGSPVRQDWGRAR